MRTFTKVPVVGFVALLLCTNIVGDLPALLYPQVVRTHKTSQLQAYICIADGWEARDEGENSWYGFRVEGPMSRLEAEATVKSLYPDADVNIVVSNGRDGWCKPPLNFDARIAGAFPEKR